MCTRLKTGEYLLKYLKLLMYIGVFPFKIIDDELQLCKKSLFLSFITSVSLLLLTSLDWMYLGVLEANMKQSKVLGYTGFIVIHSMPITQIATTLSLTYHKRTLAEVFNTIKLVERKLPYFGVPPLQKLIPAMYLLLILTSLILQITTYQFPTAVLSMYIQHWFAFFNNCALLLYTNTVLLLKHCFQSLQHSLKMKSTLKRRSLLALLDSNDLLLNCAQDLNKCFGLLLLFVLTTNFCVLTLEFHRLLQMDVDIKFKLNDLVWAIFFTLQVMHLAWTTNSTVDKAKEVKSTIIRCSYEESSRSHFLNVNLHPSLW